MSDLLLDTHVLLALLNGDTARLGGPIARLLLAQCVVEKLRLVTIDRALAGNPLAWQAG